MSEPVKKRDVRRLQIELSPAADDLLRQHFRHRGDLSKVVERLIWKEFGSEACKPTAQGT